MVNCVAIVPVFKSEEDCCTGQLRCDDDEQQRQEVEKKRKAEEAKKEKEKQSKRRRVAVVELEPVVDAQPPEPPLEDCAVCYDAT